MKLRIIFMGSPRLSVPSLKQLMLSKYEVIAVYTQPDRPVGRGRGLAASPVKEAALRWGLKVVQPESLRAAEVLAQLADFKPDVIVVCAFGQILPQAVLDIPPYQCVNVHFSLLPRHRGASPVAAAILAGDDFSGVSIQLMRTKLDTGPVLAAAAVPVSSRDNTGTLSDKLSVVGAHLLQEALIGWRRGEIIPRNQDESKATYFGQVNKEAGEIDWTRSAEEISRRVRAFYPWPGCFTYWRGKQLKINEAIVLPGAGVSEAGRVVALADGEVVMPITTGDGILGVLGVQYEGKKAMPADDFLRGQRDFIGSVLPS
jgi:methionyl-tRNA formyltransferase